MCVSVYVCVLERVYACAFECFVCVCVCVWGGGGVCGCFFCVCGGFIKILCMIMYSITVYLDLWTGVCVTSQSSTYVQ